jgi:glucosamine--fructose-6-phosphate aminotransferase (isomerizing)
MCGIIGYIGHRQATPILIGGLRKLEYRGYDSAGVSVLDPSTGDGASRVVRCRGKLTILEEKLKVGPISVIHNGIIENHLALRSELAAAGAKFSSETDTEIFAHLVAHELAAGASDLTTAVRRSLLKVRGSFAFVVMSDSEPGTLVAAKNSSPLVVGLGDGENYVASDVTAILSETRNVIFIDEGEMVTVTRAGVTITDFEGQPRHREPKTITWSAVQAEKGGFKHYMRKEIHEQPRAVADTLVGRVDLERDDVLLDGIELDTKQLRRVIFIACGTSYHASLVGEFLVESLARIPVEVDLASEFRYRDPILGPGDLIVAVSQSGETLDTMEAIREAKKKGAQVLAISNVVESSIPRLSDFAFYTHAGPEIGVASTKAFTTQLVAIAMLAIHLGRRTGALSKERARELLAELVQLPTKMQDVVESGAQLQALARRYGNTIGFLFLGRGAQYPIALEGALKLKEISYIHAEGYAAGEMKHGPIALIDEHLPVVVLAPRGPHYEKVVSNLAEVRARQGKVIAIATRGDTEIGGHADDVILVPDTALELQPILTVLPLQMLAYFVADFKGTDIDQPRNLAKSVTVE